MNLWFIVFIGMNILNLDNAKPVSQDRIKQIEDTVFTHFGKFRDPKDVQLPPQISTFDSDNFNLTNDGSGNYYFGFDTFGLKRFEIGELKNAGTENEIQVVRGQYEEREVLDDGVHVVKTIGYVADENGYQPFLIRLAFVLSTAVSLPGGPKGPKTEISGATLGSLIGGNSLG